MDLLICGLLLLLVVNYSLTKNSLHPAVVTNFVWLAVSIAFYFGQGELYSLSQGLFNSIFCWNLFFSLGSIFFSKTKVKSNPYSFSFYSSYYNLLYCFVIFSTIALILLLIFKAGGLSMSLITSLRETQLDETNPLIILFYYINSFCLVFLAYSLLNLSEVGKARFFILILLLFFLSILKTNKTGIIQFFFIIGFLLYRQNKIKIKNFLSLSLVLIAVLYVFTLFRDGGGEFDLARYMAIYALSPLCAMEMLLSGDLPIYNGAWGSGTFAFFYSFLGSIGFVYPRAEFYAWVYVPYPTNVFTIMASYYADFGFSGIIIGSLLLGSFWGFVFKLQKKNSLVWILFYAVMVYSLFFQFFADIFWGTFSITLQYLISAILIDFILVKKDRKYFKNKDNE